MATCTIQVPLGYSPRYRGGTDADDGQTVEKLREVLGQFASADFRIREIASGFVEVSMKLTRIPTAQGGSMDLEESFAGRIGDTHRMQYGETIRVDKPRDRKASTPRVFNLTFTNGR